MTEGIGLAAFRLLADQVTDLVAVFGSDGRCRFLNRAGRRLLRVPPESDAAVLELEAFVDDEDAARFRAAHATVTAGTSWTGALHLTSPITGSFPSRTTLCPVVLEDGSTGLGWIAKDTTTDRDVIRTLRQRAFYDPVTGLSHRSLFLDRLDLLLRRNGVDAHGVGVLLVTPDRFKERINRFEQGTGETLLKAIALRIPEVLGSGQTLYRWGDEDFVVLCEQVGDDDLMVIAEKIRDRMADPFDLGSRSIFLTVSIGATLGRPGRDDADTVVRQADSASHQARGAGGRVQLFDEELRARANRHVEIEDELRGAAARGELVLYYQPEVLLRTGEIVAAEALVRWQHPQRGMVSPADFIPVAESSDLIIEIGEWALREALHQCHSWNASRTGRGAVSVGINISGRQFSEDNFTARVAAALDDVGIDPKTVCLEITETVLLDDADETITKLDQLKALGVSLAIDDFGTGYSSLSYLRRFPVDILKVDQTFVKGLGHDPEDSAIVQAVVHMGQALRMTTLAEGVETAHHVIELRELHCDIAQGFHYARPMPVADFCALLAAGPDWMAARKT